MRRIGDEDTSLVDRAEERSERFTEYSDSRAADAERAHQAVAAIADGIPLGQPILVGHHSERRARKDAQRIEDGMRKAVRMWDTAAYWTDRAAGAIRNAKYKERPDVRTRRIKGLEADKRKQDRVIQEAEKWLKLWTDCSREQNPELQAVAALRLAASAPTPSLRRAGSAGVTRSWRVPSCCSRLVEAQRSKGVSTNPEMGAAADEDELNHAI